MEEITKLMDKMLNDCMHLQNKKDELFSSVDLDIDKLKGEEKTKAIFLRKSLEKAKRGELNVNEFLEGIKK